MDVTPLIPHGRKIIQSYGVGGFKVSGVKYDAGVIVLPEICLDWKLPEKSEDFTVESFSFFKGKEEDIDVLLLGTGERSQFFNPDLRDVLKSQGLKIEVMDTGAACRTYNVLMAEGRRVAAALMPI